MTSPGTATGPPMTTAPPRPVGVLSRPCRALTLGIVAAWVVPSVVGPLVSGTVTEHLGWRWVFLGIPALVLVPLAVMLPAVRRAASGPADDVTRTPSTGAGSDGLANVLLLAATGAAFAVLGGGTAAAHPETTSAASATHPTEFLAVYLPAAAVALAGVAVA